MKRMRALCLVLFAMSAVAAARGQTNVPAPSGADKVAVPAVPESSPKSPVGAPPEPLRVVCKGNQLTVAANNSTLASILNELQKCTGAKIDIPSDAAEIRFFDTIGPVSIQEGLSVLLTATGYNFVIQSSQTNPEKVEAVLLMSRTTSPSADSGNDRPLTTARRAFLKMRQDAMTEAGLTDENPLPGETSATPAAGQSPAASAENAPVNTNAPSDANQASTTSPSAAAPQENTSPRSPAADPAPASGEPKTVEDQITNMQQMFEQRRQMMQTPPPSPQQ